ncbi:COX15/CtaA family protein [Vreelandella arcis]|uniref:Cytochrome c oxidase assembly protein subunit 15 n=1 Tax=Vreelandella arcis TaxID=416873 RepID=A0A1G9YWF5_9GAMM|nr:cytochrome c oxidase assembly protein subunit 15 [Halomonas arcis]
MVNHQRITVIKGLSCIGILLTAFVMLFGAWTRLADAGLGCPDWPGCYGQWVVPTVNDAAVSHPSFPLEASKAWLEMLHRYIATLLGATAVLLVWLGWPLRNINRYPWGISVLLLFVVVAQGLFGALTVTLKLWPQVVTLHLLGGMSVLCLFVWLYCRMRLVEFRPSKPPRRASAFWWLVAVLLFGQLALGGWVSSNYAGTACYGFPSCNAQWWPEIDLSEGFHLTQTVGPNYLHGQLHADARTAIHFVHRLWGGLLGIALVILWWRHRHHKAALGLVGVVKIYCLQVMLGIASVLLWLPLWLALLHTAGAMALVVSYLLAWWRWRHGPLESRATPIYSPSLVSYWPLLTLSRNTPVRSNNLETERSTRCD